MPPGLALDRLPALLATHELGLLALFGSRARGGGRPDSDLDLAVQHRTGRSLSLRELGSLQLALAEWSGLEAQVVDLATADGLVRFEIISHGRPLYESVAGAWNELVARTLIEHDDIAWHLPALVAGVGRAARSGTGP